MAEAFYVHNAPARFGRKGIACGSIAISFLCSIGLVLVVSDESDVDPMTDAGVALFRAFNFVKTKDSAAKALSFLTDVSLVFLSKQN
jgi:hypothetical protein